MRLGGFGRIRRRRPAGEKELDVAKKCRACDLPTKTDRAWYCDDPACARRRDRARKKAPAAVVADSEPTAQAGGVFVTTMMELQAAGRVHTSAGQNALALASWMDAAGKDSGSAKAALSKQHLAALAEALRDIEVAEDPVDEIKARRLQREAG